MNWEINETNDLCLDGEMLFKAWKPKTYYTDYPTRIDNEGEKWVVCSTKAAQKAGNYVATPEIRAEIDALEKANAEFIVKACNMHNELIDMLHGCVSRMEEELAYPEDVSEIIAANKLLKRMNDVSG